MKIDDQFPFGVYWIDLSNLVFYNVVRIALNSQSEKKFLTFKTKYKTRTMALKFVLSQKSRWDKKC